MKRLSSLAILIACGLTTFPSNAQDAEQTDSFDVSTLTCAELSGASEADASLAIVMIYGYVAGDKDYTSQSALKIETVIKSALIGCASAPDQTVVSALENAGIGEAS